MAAFSLALTPRRNSSGGAITFLLMRMAPPWLRISRLWAASSVRSRRTVGILTFSSSPSAGTVMNSRSSSSDRILWNRSSFSIGRALLFLIENDFLSFQTNNIDKTA